MAFLFRLRGHSWRMADTASRVTLLVTGWTAEEIGSKILLLLCPGSTPILRHGYSCAQVPLQSSGTVSYRIFWWDGKKRGIGMLPQEIYKNVHAMSFLGPQKGWKLATNKLLSIKQLSTVKFLGGGGGGGEIPAPHETTLGLCVWTFHKKKCQGVEPGSEANMQK